MLRGIHGERIGHLGFLSATRLTPMVGSSDSARFYAAQFDRDYGAGSRWSFLGGLGLGGVLVYLTHEHDRLDAEWRSSDWWLVAGTVVSSGVSVYGTHRLDRARRALSRAIWWHNRDLAREP